MHDIRLAMARNYSENLAGRGKEGHGRKGVTGHVPRTCPLRIPQQQGRTCNRNSPRKGRNSAARVRTLRDGTLFPVELSQGIAARAWHVHLKGQFASDSDEPVLHRTIRVEWPHVPGHAPSFISAELFAQVQTVLHGGNSPTYSKHDIAFRGMLTCAHDNCTVTAELKKNKYVYYRCSGVRGKCALATLP